MNDSAAAERSQVADLLSTIDNLQQHSSDTGDYFSHVLQLMLSVVESESGAIWQPSDAGQVEAMMVVGLDEQAIDASLEDAEKTEALQWILANDEPMLFHEGDKLSRSAESLNVTLLVPLRDATHCFAVAEVHVHAFDSHQAEAMMAMVCLIAERIGKLYTMAKSSEMDTEVSRLVRTDVVQNSVGQHVEMREMSYEVVNQLQQYLPCDRVSLAIVRGESARVKAVSNQALFDRRSNVIRRIEKLSREIARIEDSLWLPADEDQIAPQLRKLSQSYFDAANTLSVGLIPIMAEPKRRDDPKDIAATIRSSEERKRCIAVLIVEGIETPLARDDVERRWSRVEPSVSNAVRASRKYDGFFLMPVWRSLGTAADWYRGHTKRKAWLITAGIAAVIASLVLIPADFKLRGVGEIQPLTRQHVYAESDGTIRQLTVADGDQVESGQLLMQLDNPKISAEVSEVEGRLREANAEHRTLVAMRASRAFENEQEERELVRKSVTVEARIRGLENQLSLLQKKQQQLEVISPMGGEVITWDVAQRLQNRPVQPGERLLTVAQRDGPWEIELRIPDKRSGYLLKTWNERKASEEEFPVTFVLASDPLEPRVGTVTEVAPSSNVDDKDSENVIRVRVKLSDEEFQKLGDVRPGTSVIGHVVCGRASIGYCKLYEFFDWTKRMWFKFVS